MRQNDKLMRQSMRLVVPESCNRIAINDPSRQGRMFSKTSAVTSIVIAAKVCLIS